MSKLHGNFDNREDNNRFTLKNYKFVGSLVTVEFLEKCTPLSKCYQI